MGECPEGFTIERVDTNGNYTPTNCIWATVETQNANRRCNKLKPEQIDEIRSSTLTQRKLAKLFGVSQSQISNVKRGKQHIKRLSSLELPPRAPES